MSEEAVKGPAEAKTLATPAVVEEVPAEVTKPRGGWVKSLVDGHFHEVDDVDLTVESYPGQYEEVKESDVRKNKVGWPTTAEG